MNDWKLKASAIYNISSWINLYPKLSRSRPQKNTFERLSYFICVRKFSSVF